MLYEFDGVVPTLEDPDCWVAPNATLIGKVVVKRDASVWWSAVLRGDEEPITVGAGSNIQDGSVCHTDPGFPLNVGERVTVGHMAMLHGCTIGNDSLIGIGAIVLNGAVIGSNCLIGAKALITEGKEIPDNSIVLGAPGKVVGEVSDRHRAMIARGAESYINRWRRYRETLREHL